MLGNVGKNAEIQGTATLFPGIREPKNAHFLLPTLVEDRGEVYFPVQFLKNPQLLQQQLYVKRKQ